MQLEKNKCYNLLRRGKGEELIFLLSVDYCRTIYGTNRFTLSYSEVHGVVETCVDFENVEYIYEVPMTDAIKQRLVNKWGEDIASERGITLEKETANE